MGMAFRKWSLSTRILVLSAVGVIVLAMGCAVYVALFMTVTSPGIYLIGIPIAGPIAAVPVVLFAIALGFKPQPRTGAAVVAVLYGVLVLLLGTVKTIQTLIYWSNVTPPPTYFEPPALDLFLISVPGALAILAAGTLALLRRSRAKATSGRAFAQG